MQIFLHLTVAAIQLALAGVLNLQLQARWTLGLLFTLLVTVALVYDNTVIGVGAWIGEGQLLATLNWLRYIIHALLTPLLAVFAIQAVMRANLPWSLGRLWAPLTGSLVIAMIIYGISIDLIGLQLEPELDRGLLSYVPVGEAPLPIPAFVTAALIVAVGIALWVQRGTKRLALFSIAAVICFGLGPALDQPVIGQVGELLLIGGIMLSEVWLQRFERYGADKREQVTGATIQ